MDSAHGVLPLPVATWVLPVNPHIYTRFSVCLAACLLSVYYCLLLSFPFFCSFFLIVCLSRPTAIFITGSTWSVFLTVYLTSSGEWMIVAGLCRKWESKTGGGGMSEFTCLHHTVMNSCHQYRNNRRICRLTPHSIERHTKLGCNKVGWQTEQYKSY